MESPITPRQTLEKNPSQSQAHQPHSPNINWRDGLVAALIVVALCLVYLMNGCFLIGNDVKGTLYLPGNLLHSGSFAFSPSSAPLMFNWIYVDAHGSNVPGDINSWDEKIDGVTASELRAAGRLRVYNQKYYLTPSIRTDPQTGDRLYVNTFGPGAAAVALPWFALISLLKGDLWAQPWYLWYGGKLLASVLVACSAALVFLTARRSLALWPSLLIAAAYGLGTSVWSVSSQTLWQHGPNEFFLALGTFFLLHDRGRFRDGPGQAVILSYSEGSTSLAESARSFGVPLDDRELAVVQSHLHSRRHHWTSAACGFCYACAVACRPDSIFFALCAAGYYLIYNRRQLAFYCLAALPIALMLGVYNQSYLGSPFTFGQSQAGHAIATLKTGSPDLWQTPWYTGLTGVLLSPSRGLFVYSTFLLFSLAGAWRVWSDRRWIAMRPLTVAVAMMIFLEAKHYDWWGGWSWSYRKIVDVTPALAVLLVPVIGAILRRRGTGILFLALVGIAIFIQAIGAFAFDLDGWNAPVIAAAQGPGDVEIAATSSRSGPAAKADIDEPAYRSRLWSWGDNPIFYYTSHFSDSRDRKIKQADMWLDAGQDRHLLSHRRPKLRGPAHAG